MQPSHAMNVIRNACAARASTPNRVSPTIDVMSVTTRFLLLCDWRRLLLLVMAFAFPAAGPALGAKPGKEERRELRRDDSAAPAKNTRDEAQSRAQTKLRDQMDVTDDAEWEVISQRIATVTELRRMVAGAAGARGAVVADKVKAAGRTDRSAQQEQDALRSAVRDKLPDAEIKARLSRAHDVHVQNEAKLEKAQEELRAVLSVRQEAVAVVFGFLP